MVHLDYRDVRPIYSQIADGFREQILSGVLSDGDKLPSVRELAVELSINPNTIQRAYRELETQGWIATVSGKGCFVLKKGADADREALLGEFDRLAAALMAEGVSVQALTERLKGGK